MLITDEILADVKRVEKSAQEQQLLAPVVHKSVEVLALEKEIERLKDVLLFYAHPERHHLNGRWSTSPVGGVEYTRGTWTFCDTGELAQIALERCVKEVRNGEGA